VLRSVALCRRDQVRWGVLDSNAMATRMPLTHFPGDRPIHEWAEWGALVSPESRHRAEPEDTFDALEWGHVFLYAGPCCYAADRGGDSAMYFAPGSERGWSGAAAPFDTGACKPESRGGRLQPFARSEDDSACSALIDTHSVELDDGWRDMFADWLDRCHAGTPDKYLETKDPWTDGEPTRTEPEELLANNGRRGREVHEPCADRRAWTWEVRTESAVPFSSLACVQVLPNRYRDALDARRRLGVRADFRIEQLRDGAPAGVGAFYRQSDEVLRSLMGASE
jgi:hypothetical protein